MRTAPTAPSRYPQRPRILRAIMALFDREFDTYTGSWVRRGWIEERQALTDKAYRQELERRAAGRPSNSTCLLCNQDMDLHPPQRMWVADPAMCPDRR